MLDFAWLSFFLLMTGHVEDSRLAEVAAAISEEVCGSPRCFEIDPQYITTHANARLLEVLQSIRNGQGGDRGNDPVIGSSVFRKSIDCTRCNYPLATTLLHCLTSAGNYIQLCVWLDCYWWWCTLHLAKEGRCDDDAMVAWCGSNLRLSNPVESDNF